MQSSGQAPPERRAAAPDAAAVYEFGRFRLRPAKRQLTDLEDEAVDLTAKAFDALTYLVTHAGRLISREEMTGVLWPHTIVEENNLNQTIWALRKALGDDSRQQRLIATVPGRGYQFVADVRTVPGPGEGAGAGAGAATSSPSAGTDAENAPAARGAGRLRNAAAVTAIVVLVLAIAGFLAVPAPPRFGTRSEPVLITTQSGYEYAPSLSHDGMEVAYASDNGDAYSNVFIKSVDGSGVPHPLTAEQGLHRAPALSPNGRFVAFLRQNTPLDFDLMITGSRDDSPRKLISLSMRLLSRYGSPLIAWSSNDRYVLFSSNDREDAHDTSSTLIYAIDVDTRIVKTLTSGEQVFDTSPALAPDASGNAFTRYINDVRFPVLMYQPLGPDLEPSGPAYPVQGAPTDIDLHSLSWTPDSDFLIFVAGKDLYAWPVGGEARSEYRFVDAPGQLSLIWKEGKPLIVATQPRVNLDIWVLPLDPLTFEPTGPPTQRFESSELEEHPVFSPDDSKVAFVRSTAGGVATIFIADADGSNPEPMPDPPAGISGRPSWSPDSRRIAFHASNAREPRQVYIYDIDAGTVEHLGPGATPEWSPDGEYIYVTLVGPEATTNEVAWIRVEDLPGKPTRGTLFTGDMPTVSLDGKYLLFSRVDEFGIWRVPLEGNIVGNEPERLVWDYTPTLGAYVPVEDGLIYPAHTPEGIPHKFRHYNFVTDVYTDIAPAPGRLALGLSFSSERGELLYAAPTPDSGSDLVLLEFR